MLSLPLADTDRSPKRIFVTGATGYLGLHIVGELLAHGHAVTALVRSPHKLGPLGAAPGIRVVTRDLDEGAPPRDTLAGQDVCVHAALLWGQPGTELELRDTAAAAQLFDAAGRAGVARCILLSSAAVHRPFAANMTEDDTLTTTDAYGATKAAGELFLRAACAEHGMRGIVLRPGPVVGPPAFVGGSFRSDQRVAEMLAAATRNAVIEVVAGEGRQLSAVRSVAQVVRVLATAEDPLPTYLCVDREAISWEHIARTAVACAGSASEVRVVARPLMNPLSRFRTERIEELLGGPMDARDALRAHLEHLVRVPA